jgi:hypothetical protein
MGDWERISKHHFVAVLLDRTQKFTLVHLRSRNEIERKVSHADVPCFLTFHCAFSVALPFLC